MLDNLHLGLLDVGMTCHFAAELLAATYVLSMLHIVGRFIALTQRA